MNVNELFVYVWLFPVASQIFLPLIILSLWALAGIPRLLFGKQASNTTPSPA